MNCFTLLGSMLLGSILLVSMVLSCHHCSTVYELVRLSTGSSLVKTWLQSVLQIN